jgi:hypothetical protein
MGDLMDHETPEYERVLTAIYSVEAPMALRERVQAERERTFVRRTVVKRMKLTSVLAGVAALLGIVVGLAASGGGADPSSLEVAALATRGAAAAAPAPSARDPRFLEARVEDVSFPVYSGRYPWRASGRRTDEIGGRDTTTVFYDGPNGARLGYTIVAGDALDWPGGAQRVVRNGVDVRVARGNGRVVAVWREHGHTCVISAPDSVPAERLVALASAPYAT